MVARTRARAAPYRQPGGTRRNVYMPLDAGLCTCACYPCSMPDPRRCGSSCRATRTGNLYFVCHTRTGFKVLESNPGLNPAPLPSPRCPRHGAASYLPRLHPSRYPFPAPLLHPLGVVVHEGHHAARLEHTHALHHEAADGVLWGVRVLARGHDGDASKQSLRVELEEA